MNPDQRRRAFQLANLSEDLATLSERLASQAMAMATAALLLTEQIEATDPHLGNGGDGHPKSTGRPAG
jgi:hypothetical protein